MPKIFRSPLFLVVIAVLLMPWPAIAQSLEGKLYKNPECTCCEAYAEYLEKNGFKIEVITTDDLDAINHKAGVPDSLEGCHALIIQGYVVQGHVPVEIIRKLLNERPDIVGISLPGMPVGVPGMKGTRTESLAVYEIEKTPASKPKIFATLQ